MHQTLIAPFATRGPLLRHAAIGMTGGGSGQPPRRRPQRGSAVQVKAQEAGASEDHHRPTVLITGCSSGFGAASARLFAARG